MLSLLFYVFHRYQETYNGLIYGPGICPQDYKKKSKLEKKKVDNLPNINIRN
jgi:hypothetical protein